ncbi:hypothetical protein ACFX2K_009891 [Malus domestica]
MRQNGVVSKVAPQLQGSTMAQAMPSKLAQTPAQALHSHAPRIEQLVPDEQPTPVPQPALTEQPTIVA